MDYTQLYAPNTKATCITLYGYLKRFIKAYGQFIVTDVIY